jgi:hypothetical protein
MSAPILLVIRLLMALALYAFLGTILLILWRDMQRQSELLSLRRVPNIKLVNLSNGNSEFYQFNTTQVIIGRDPTSDCHLRDDTVSAKHAQLTFHHSNWWVEDLRSKNGTYLNQESADEPLVLTSGDQIRCGEVVLLVSIIKAES